MFADILILGGVVELEHPSFSVGGNTACIDLNHIDLVGSIHVYVPVWSMLSRRVDSGIVLPNIPRKEMQWKEYTCRIWSQGTLIHKPLTLLCRVA